jgi:hypothetical protein
VLKPVASPYSVTSIQKCRRHNSFWNTGASRPRTECRSLKSWTQRMQSCRSDSADGLRALRCRETTRALSSARRYACKQTQGR